MHKPVCLTVFSLQTRVKKLFKKQDEALVQFRTIEQAAVARSHISGTTLFGNRLRVNESSVQLIKLPTHVPGETSPEHFEVLQRLTQDYSGSLLHRFRTERHVQHICPPSNTIHVSNIPVALPQDDLVRLFSAHGMFACIGQREMLDLICSPRLLFAGTVVNSKWVDAKSMGSLTKMCLISMASTDEATTALVLLHNHKIDDRYIRVTFSRSRPTM